MGLWLSPLNPKEGKGHRFNQRQHWRLLWVRHECCGLFIIRQNESLSTCRNPQWRTCILNGIKWDPWFPLQCQPTSSFLTEVKSVCYLKLSVTFSSLFLFSGLVWGTLKCPRHSRVWFEVWFLFHFLRYLHRELTELVQASTFAQHSSSISRCAFIRATLMTKS